MENKLSEQDLRQMGGYVAEAMGLDFPPERSADLRRGIEAAGHQLGFGNTTACARWFLAGLASPKQLEGLASYLTVGETYFFRDKRSFEILAEEILPSIIAARRDGSRRLRIWSAACCTGEEAYSIAIVLRQAIPDWQDWNVTILATDINSRFLRKAGAGTFGRWSFRDTQPYFKERYFRPTADGQLEIAPEIRKMVHFANLNLVEDVYPSLTTNTNAMDVIFCRNVLMYFTAPQAQRVIHKLHRAQAEGGWLVVGASELPHVSCGPYVTANFGGTVFYRREGPTPNLPPLPIVESPRLVCFDPLGEVAKRIATRTPPPEPEVPKPAKLKEMAMSLANEGRLADALAYCDRWIEIESLNASAHYLRAVILQEQGLTDQAVGALRGALYLEPDFVMAHFAMGNIARAQGDFAEAERHLENARMLLRDYEPDDVLSDSEGVTAGRFSQIVQSLIEMEAVA